ncbi:hypothetical protein MVEN_00572200 [Mycena venus]|uniref:Uncharacterized protein n=1 Tax=Mycena venus TaxID=2733690 RepID=A0A8H6YLS1_9AGAR|nr:hypothetical protein MVEN_00572200 [Mycena venus]
MYGQRSQTLPQPMFNSPMIQRAQTHGYSLPKKSRGRAVPVRGVMSSAPARASPLRDIPTEIGLEIVELALLSTPSTILALVSKKFNALVCKMIYKTVILDRLSRITLFHRTVLSKSLEFLGTHVLTLAVTSRSYTTEARIQLEQIVAACTGLRTLAIPRPGILASGVISRTRPIELIIQKFDAMTPFEWDPLFAQEIVVSPAARISQNLTRLRICEPGQVWHSPLETLEFFGSLPGLTHLALARHVNPYGGLNDGAFVSEIRTLLETRPELKMLIVSLFPAAWPRQVPATFSLCGHSCICKALIRLADTDKRLVVLATGWDTLLEPDKDPRSPFPPHVNHGSARLGVVSFWENWRMSDKRVVAFTTGWEPEIVADAVKWTYPTVPTELSDGSNFWGNWLTLPN